MIIVTTRFQFPAAHVLAQPAFSADKNRQIYGKCANPAGHGHDYSVEVAVSGPIDSKTGQIIVPGVLAEIFEETIRARYAHRMLNEESPFETIVPTAENMALVFEGLLSEAVANRSSAHVAQVRVVETRRNSAESGEIE
ncbi:MAG: 6-carboxytetrahydropterin synthase [Myxococcota bacterium]|nr:6-carboxytetrahydropterin synthase [Myxococcota bacterium]